MRSHKRRIDRFARMNLEIQHAHEEATRVVKKQRMAAKNTSESLSAIISSVTELQEKLQNVEFNFENLQQELDQLNMTITNEDYPGKMVKDTRELHSSISRLGKVSLSLSVILLLSTDP